MAEIELILGADRERIPLQNIITRVGRDDIMPLSVMAWVTYANRKREALGAGAGAPAAPTHRPLVVFEDDRCLNLELLARHRGDYVLAVTK